MVDEETEAEIEAEKDVKKDPKEEESSDEDPKQIARQMFTDGYDQPGIVESIVETTGLSQRSVWALKGALARSGAIPTKKQIEEREQKERHKEKFGPEPDEEAKERGVPFRRPRPPHLLLRQVLEEFGVKERAIEIIVTRCRRQGEMHPTEVQQHLSKIESGIKKSEADYIADEYYFALQHEEEQATEYGGGVSSYPTRRGSESGSPRTYSGYGGRRTTREPDHLSPQSPRRDRRPWDSQRQDSLSENRMLEILDRRDQDRDQRDRERTLESEVSDMGKTMVELMSEIRHMRENPPSSVPADVVTVEQLKSHQADSYQKALELQLTALKDDRKELMEVLKDTQKENKESVKDIREFYDKKIDKLTDKLEEAKTSAPRSGDGYTDDNVRLAAQGMDSVAKIIERKEPVKVIIEGLGQLAQTGEQRPMQPRPKLEGDEEITDAIPSEYLE